MIFSQKGGYKLAAPNLLFSLFTILCTVLVGTLYLSESSRNLHKKKLYSSLHTSNNNLLAKEKKHSQIPKVFFNATL